MESHAIARYQRVSPRKARLVAHNVQGLGVEDAMNILRFTPNKPAGIIYRVMKSALANATQSGGVDHKNSQAHKPYHSYTFGREGIGYGSKSTSFWLPVRL